MKQSLRRTAAGLLSAAMLCSALPADTVYAESAEDTLRQMIRTAWEERQDKIVISSLRMNFEDVADSLKRFSPKDKGFVRMKVISSPYVIPVQIDKFEKEDVE